ncbi:hypothetical protein [Frankia sp. R82]|uniref:hypothetical protein n=1 Tax=Frankia sp. R82 TaxID=2950553 RepID=UPI002043FB84|nr:hypothetical protein [Frankia sp. R82]MCM3885515.1 hypothetical protein [Frankia sp. R82]
MRIDERRIPISGALRPWISDISVTTIPIHDGEGTVVEPPDHSAALALRIFPGEYTDLVVMGPRTRALYHVGKPGPFCVSARIQPGHASSLLGHTVAGLRERIVPSVPIPPGSMNASYSAGSSRRSRACSRPCRLDIGPAPT